MKKFVIGILAALVAILIFTGISMYSKENAVDDFNNFSEDLQDDWFGGNTSARFNITNPFE